MTLHARPEDFTELAEELGVPSPIPIEKKTRADGKLSLPDAVILLADSLAIVVDAKFYTTEVSSDTIKKTLNDMELRGTPFGILVCSEGAGVAKFASMQQS